MSNTERFRAKVQAFLDLWDYPPSAFGRKAAGDPSFTHRILNTNRSVSLATVDRVEAWMEQEARRLGAIPGRQQGTPVRVRQANPFLPIIWTPEMDAALLEMRSKKRLSWDAIADAIGISIPPAQRRFYKLQEEIAAAAAKPKQRRTGIPPKPPTTTNGSNA